MVEECLNNCMGGSHNKSFNPIIYGLYSISVYSLENLVFAMLFT